MTLISLISITLENNCITETKLLIKIIKGMRHESHGNRNNQNSQNDGNRAQPLNRF